MNAGRKQKCLRNSVKNKLGYAIMLDNGSAIQLSKKSKHNKIF